MSIVEITVAALAFELIVIWVIREQTRLVKRVRLGRLLQVGGVATLVSAALGWALALDLSRAMGGVLVSSLPVLAVTIAGEGVLYRKVARLRWGQSWVFSGLANIVAWLGVTALLYLTGTAR